MVATFAEAAKNAVTLTQAADFIPSRPHVATVWRWATRGVRGNKLETIFIGGRRMVTPAAIEDFLCRLNAQTPLVDEAHEAVSKSRGKAAKAAVAKLVGGKSENRQQSKAK